MQNIRRVKIMVSWKNFDTLASYEKLMALKGHVNLVEVMSGENGAKRVAESVRTVRSALLSTAFPWLAI